MSKSNVNPDHYKIAGRERQGEDIAQARNKQKHAESVVRQRTEAGARARKPAPRKAAATTVAPTRAAKTATPKARVTTPKAPTLTAKQATKRASVNLQGADKRGKRPQQRESSRDEFAPTPATKPVAGAFGKEPSPRGPKSRSGKRSRPEHVDGSGQR